MTGTDAGPIRVALVDDVEDIRRLVRTALRFRGGFEVVGEARTGADAIAMAAEQRPDIVVLDLGLPDIAGRDVLARVREASPATRVVVFSAREPTDRAWFEERTAGYVLKDADLDYLVDLLENVGRTPADVRVLDATQGVVAGRKARALVRDALHDWDLPAILDDAVLVVTELVTNAVTHGGSASVAAVPHLRGVPDRGGRRGRGHSGAAASGHRGRGWSRAHAGRRDVESWGVENVPRGKLVWAEIAIP